MPRDYRKPPSLSRKRFLTPFFPNGGPTPTHSLRSGSPAINAGSNALAVDHEGNPLLTDQRGAGFDRIRNGTVDIGAFEFYDPDQDGVDAGAENGHPNNGDGNSDGILDSEQAHVASFANPEDGSYLTLVAASGAPLLGVHAVAASTVADDAPAGTIFPIGLVGFTTTVSADGAATTVDILLAQPTPLDAYYKYGPTADNPTPHLYEFSFDGTSGAELIDLDGDGAVERIVLHLVDGARGDADLTANGVIVDPGGAGYNPPPILEPIAGPAAGVPGQPLAFSVDFTDLGGDLHSATIDWGDGNVQLAMVEPHADGGRALGEHAYTLPGTYTLRIEVTDSAGNVVSVEKQIAVETLRLEDDPDNPGNMILVVGGTPGNDHVDFKAKKGGKLVSVQLNGQKLGEFDAADLSRLEAYGGEGKDKIKVHGSIAIDAWLYGGPGNDHLEGGRGNDRIFGGEGNDHLKGHDGDDFLDGGPGNDHLDGGKGHDVLSGGEGNDKLHGGQGNNVLIGGGGRNDLKGGKGDDLLIAGFTLFDNNPAALDAIRREWSSTRDYETRIDNLRNGSGEFLAGTGIRLAASGPDRTVFADGQKDKVKGGAGRDWFFANLEDDLKDKKKNEELDEILLLLPD